MPDMIIMCKACGEEFSYPLTDEDIMCPVNCEVRLIMKDDIMTIENGDRLEGWRGFKGITSVKIEHLCPNTD